MEHMQEAGKHFCTDTLPPKWPKGTNLDCNLGSGLQSSSWLCKVQLDSWPCSLGNTPACKTHKPSKIISPIPEKELESGVTEELINRILDNPV